MRRAVPFVLALASSAPALANDYCDHVQAVAAAESALEFAPEVFGTLGYSKQPGIAGAVDPVATAGPRVTAGIAYSLTNIFEGAALRGRARADCKRRTALDQIASAPTYRALEARARVLDAAVPEAEQILAKVETDVKERLTTEKELVATRLRTDELRNLAAETRRALAALPAPSASSALAAYYAADGELEASEARLRKLKAFDVTVRGGYDRFLDRTDDTPYFAMLSVSVNTGVLFQGGANDRAGTARTRMVRGEEQLQLGGGTTAQLEAQLAVNTKRVAQTAALIADLESQMEAIAKLGGDDGRRYRQTLWFDLIKVKAEHQYVVAHSASLREALGK